MIIINIIIAMIIISKIRAMNIIGKIKAMGITSKTKAMSIISRIKAMNIISKIKAMIIVSKTIAMSIISRIKAMSIISKTIAIGKRQIAKYKSWKPREGFLADSRIALLSVVLLLPLLVITINHNSAYSSAIGTEQQEKYEYLASFFSEPEPASKEEQQDVEPAAVLSEILTVATPRESYPWLYVGLLPELPAIPGAEITAQLAAQPDGESIGSEENTGADSGDDSMAEDDTQTKIAYITIDDGPSYEVTTGILDLLQQEGIKATFFVLPYSGRMDLYQRIIDEGHEIGNHSYSHNYSKLYKKKDIEAFEEDVLKAQEWLFEDFGYIATSFRFPGGAMGRKASIVDPRREFLAEQGFRDFDWHVDTGDANSNQKDKSAEALSGRVLDNTRDREQLIILMHDTSSKVTTLEALPIIISGLREQGYTFDILRNY